jgi:hypothetical protein
VSIKALKEIFECNGLGVKDAQLLARYVIENPSSQQKSLNTSIVYKEDLAAKQRDIITHL